GVLQRMVRDQLAALNRLQQGVMEVACDTGAFRQPLVEACLHGPGDLPYSNAIESRRGEQDSDRHGHRKPSRLKPRRLDTEVERGPRLVPHASVVAGDDTEAIASWAKIVVHGLATIAGLLPVAVVSFELVAEQHLPRELEAQRGVVDFDLSRPRWQARRRNVR